MKILLISFFLLTSINASNLSIFLDKINAQINTFTYKKDSTNYGINEYWATYQEFKKHNGGDCEDFSIAKGELVLNQYGLSGDNLRLAIVELNDGQRHTVLLIHTEENNYILDNNHNKIVNKIQEIPNFKKYITQISWNKLELYRTQVNSYWANKTLVASL